MDEKLTTRWYLSKVHRQHSKRIQEIKAKPSTRIDNCPPNTQKRSNIKYTLNERESQIKSENKKILNILVDISRRRRSTSTGLILDSALSLPRKKSLNLIIRKQETERINLDNEALARRMMCTNRCVSFKKLNEQWKATEKYKKTISKSRFRSLPTDRSRKSIKEKAESQRTQSVCEDPLSFYLKDKGSPLNRSIVLIEDHRPTDNFLIQGQKKTRTNKTFEPLLFNPPKAYIKLDPIANKLKK